MLTAIVLTALALATPAAGVCRPPAGRLVYGRTLPLGSVTRAGRSHPLPAAQRVGEDVAVGVLDVAAGGQAAGEAGDLHLGEARADEADRRNIRMELTPRAEELHRAMQLRARKRARDAIAGMGDDECRRLVALLGTIRVNLEKTR